MFTDVVHTCTYICQSSWRRQLRTKFKNLRRPDRASKAGIAVPPAPKKARIVISLESPKGPSSSSMAEYERHIQFLQESYSSNKWSLSSMLTLVKETADKCREWIQTTGPSVKQVLETFPCFADPRIVRLLKVCRNNIYMLRF